ncbi:MAG: peptide-methionine (S)-S-oxide reductase [Parcubacteria group bacterium Gr01-1014_20]|nr:MAG: peptide-methionine (S)-S-oxide reductase [Parcubacteria group bacterium Gr01-1014_20]
MGLFGFGRTRDAEIRKIFRDHIVNTRKCAYELRTIFGASATDFQLTPERISRIEEMEHEGDRLTHQLNLIMNDAFITWIEKDDIHHLIIELDEVVDNIKKVVLHVRAYGISAGRQEASDFCGIITRMTELLTVLVEMLDKPNILHAQVGYCRQSRLCLGPNLSRLRGDCFSNFVFNQATYVETKTSSQESSFFSNWRLEYNEAMTSDRREIVVFGGGCFWCTEAVFQGLKGVISVMPGYAGGPSTGDPPVSGPTYDEVCSGKTGHAEVIKIEFNPSEISYKDLLTVFFATHDPTTPNRQGNDVGTQYRSVIFYTNDNQRRQAEDFIAGLNSPHLTGERIVTEIKPLNKFYEAEADHRDYYKKNSAAPYCQVVINPKLQKMQEKFYRLVKKSKEKGAGGGILG